jgi:AcrR family transcriptional regulator
MRGLRADARRNQVRILAAARDTVIEHGPDAPLEEIAARAGVGIATLYRRFPHRRALLRAVALDTLQQVATEAELALAEESNAWQALVRYMRRALELRVSAVLPALVDRVSLDDEEFRAARDRSAALIQQMIDQAQAEGTLRTDVTFADISLLLIRLSRPLPGPFPRALRDDLAHRHLTLLLDALGADRDRAAPLPGPALTLADLRSLPPAPERNRPRPPDA